MIKQAYITREMATLLLGDDIPVYPNDPERLVEGAGCRLLAMPPGPEGKEIFLLDGYAYDGRDVTLALQHIAKLSN